MMPLSKAPRFVLTARDLSVLEGLGRYRLLCTRQIMALCRYPSLQKVQHRLLLMHRSRLVSRFQNPVLPGHGKGEYIYMLARAGMSLLGEDGKGTVHNLRRQGHCFTLQMVQHTLSLNWLIIFSIQAAEADEEVSIAGLIPEYWGERSRGMPKRRSEDQVADPTGAGDASFIPDLVLVLKKRDKQSLFFCEVDIGTEPIGAKQAREGSVLRKMLLYRQYMEARGYERYAREFGYQFAGFRVLWITSAPSRIEQMRRVCSQHGIKKMLWLTTSADLSQDTILTSHIWRLADAADEGRHALIG